MARFSSKNKSNLRLFKPEQKKIKSGLHDFLIESLAEDARGVARPKGKATFVRGALPGEKVRGRYTATHKQYDEASCVSIQSESESRVVPPCSYYGECGGCVLQHLEYDAQLVYKQKRLEKLFAPLQSRQQQALTWEQPLTGNSYNYRHRARLAVKANQSLCKIGFRRMSSHDIVDIDHCHILRSKLNSFVPAIKRIVKALKFRSQVEEVLITEGANGVVAAQLIVKKELIASDYKVLERMSKEEGLWMSVQSKKDLYGSALWRNYSSALDYALVDQAFHLQYNINDFTQVNPMINAMMITKTLQWLEIDKTDNLLDFFCGLGNFSLPIAKYANQVTGIEVVRAMVDKATENALINNISNITFEQRDLFDSCFDWAEPANKAILDPPRAGAEQLCRQLCNSNVDQIVYISCDPVTLARDATILQKGGYYLDKISLIDMFAQTHHVETMLLLRRNLLKT